MATEADDAFNQQAVDSLLNFETVLYFNAQEHISEQYDTSLKAVAAANIDSQLSLSLLNILQNAVISVGVALAMGIAGHEVKKGRMTVGDFVLVQVFILQLYAPLGFLGTYWRMIKAALVDVEAMFKLLHEGQDVKDMPDAKELRVGAAADVRFEDVVFTFEPKRGPILRGVTLEARAGQKLAIVGSSGAGKSTLARLLYRLYNIDSGRVLISGVDIATCTQRSVRFAIGIVPQGAYAVRARPDARSLTHPCARTHACGRLRAIQLHAALQHLAGQAGARRAGARRRGRGGGGGGAAD